MERTPLNKAAFVLALVLIAFATVAYGAVHQAVLAMVYVCVAVLAVLWGLECFRSGEIKVSNHGLVLPLFAAAVYGFIQVAPFGGSVAEAGVSDIPRTISQDPFATLLTATHFLALSTFLAVLLTLVDSAARLRKVVVAISVFGFIYAFFSVLQSVLSPEKIYGIYGRPGASMFGSFVNRNHFAAWMEMAIALPLGLLFSGAVPKDKRLLYGTAVALMGASIIASGSRGGLVAFLAQVIALSLMTYASGKHKLGLRIALAAGLIAVVVGGAVFVGGETSLSRLADAQTASGTNQDRSHIWSVSMAMIREGMPFGVGLGAFGTAYTRYDKNSGLERVEQAHNDYLQVITDAGIPGALIGIGFFYLLYRTGRRSLAAENDQRRAIGVGSLAGIIGVLIHSAFDFVLHTTAVSMFFLLLLAVLVAASGRLPDDLSDERRERKRRRRSRSSEETVIGGPPIDSLKP